MSENGTLLTGASVAASRPALVTEQNLISPQTNPRQETWEGLRIQQTPATPVEKISIARDRSFVIGLAFPFSPKYLFKDPHMMELLRGVEQIAAEHHYDILLTPAREQDDVESSIRRLLRAKHLDGAIVVGMKAGTQKRVGLDESAFPIIGLGYHSLFSPENTVHADNRRGALQATRHLISLGHQRIGIINIISTLMEFDERLAGYKQALAESRIHFQQQLVAYGNFTEESGAYAAKDLIERSPRPTAIFAFNDRMALGAIRYLQDEGIRVPEDIAVVGFDDIPAAGLNMPKLTTVRQPAIEMGKTAGRLLFGLIQGKLNRFPEAILPAMLQVRESCGGG